MRLRELIEALQELECDNNANVEVEFPTDRPPHYKSSGDIVCVNKHPIDDKITIKLNTDQ